MAARIHFAHLFALIQLVVCLTSAVGADRPNVLMIAIDDLNDWVGCMGGHPQAKTPNLDRFAQSGILFTGAHCPAPACNPSRTAIMTGRSPHRTGLYENMQKMREILPHAEIMPKTFSRHGYHSAGSGKLLHYFIDAASWNDYFPDASSENPFPRTMYPDHRPVSLPRGGPWQYVETDWGPLDATDEQFGGDYLVSQWIGEQLRRNDPERRLFLACGLYRPHEPWFVPKKYFEPFPLESIQLPPGYRDNDLEDLPQEGKRRGPNRYFAHIRGQGQWKQGIQGYLASIHFSDAMLGRVLAALDQSPSRDNTIVVLWSDHGWHLGEKQHWQKFSPWRVCTRVPLIVRVPEGASAKLPLGTPSGVHCDQPVNLLSLFPTLLELCGLPPEKHHDAPSLLPLLGDVNAPWPHLSLTFLSDGGSVAISGRSWRFIRYAGGGEELYNTDEDPFEWKNLASDAAHADVLEEFRQHVPSSMAPKRMPRDSSLPALRWHPATDRVPASEPDGNPFDVVFVNKTSQVVKLYWMTPQSPGRKHYADIDPGKRKRQQTRPGAVWMIADADSQPLGYFRVGDRSARAIVPAPAPR